MFSTFYSSKSHYTDAFSSFSKWLVDASFKSQLFKRKSYNKQDLSF
jgi:hypothetical protein